MASALLPQKPQKTQKPQTMPGTTLPLSVAHKAHSAGNNFINPNSPDATRAIHGMKILGLA
jgi:hypothetical protein